VTGILLIVASAVGGSVHAESLREPINTFKKLFAALWICWERPARDCMELTVRLSLARFGRFSAKGPSSSKIMMPRTMSG
jgi:NAD dependent epimerase/dehydratase family enzyme